MKVLLIDDHAMFREGVALLLQPLVEGIEVWQAGSCEEAISALDETGAADLVLIDLGLPGMSGLQGIAYLREQYPQMPLVALSSLDERENVLAAIDAGAMGFVPKTSTSSVLVAALRLIMAKGIYLPPKAFLPSASERAHPPMASRAFVSRMSTAAAAGEKAQTLRPADLGLTPRQADVLYQILQGRSAKVIGRELDLSASTVKAHTSAVLRALNVTTRTQAVIEAGRLGLRF